MAMKYALAIAAAVGVITTTAAFAAKKHPRYVRPPAPTSRPTLASKMRATAAGPTAAKGPKLIKEHGHEVRACHCCGGWGVDRRHRRFRREETPALRPPVSRAGRGCARAVLALRRGAPLRVRPG